MHDAIDKALMVRKIASKAPQETLSQIVNKGLECLACRRSLSTPKITFSSTVQELRRKDLRPLTLGWRVFSSRFWLYEEKAQQCIANNLKPVDPKETQSAKKKSIPKLLEREECRGLVTKIRESQQGESCVFFLEKIHKDWAPFRTILSKRHT